MSRAYALSALSLVGIAATIGVVITAAALAATLVCWKRMGRDWRMGIDPAERTRLIVTGPYAYVRHPIYALSQLMMLGTVIAVPAPAMTSTLPRATTACR